MNQLAPNLAAILDFGRFTEEADDGLEPDFCSLGFLCSGVDLTSFFGGASALGGDAVCVTGGAGTGSAASEELPVDGATA